MRLLVVCPDDHDEFQTVMPALRLRSGQAPAGIQFSPLLGWIPAFAGMT